MTDKEKVEKIQVRNPSGLPVVHSLNVCKLLKAERRAMVRMVKKHLAFTDDMETNQILEMIRDPLLKALVERAK